MMNQTMDPNGPLAFHFIVYKPVLFSLGKLLLSFCMLEQEQTEALRNRQLQQLLEQTTMTLMAKSRHILADKCIRFHRRDPIDGLKHAGVH